MGDLNPTNHEQKHPGMVIPPIRAPARSIVFGEGCAAGPLRHQTVAMADQRARGVQLPFPHNARPFRPELGHTGKPAAVSDIRLRNCVTCCVCSRCASIPESRGRSHGAGQRDPGAFHQRRGNAMRRQPSDQHLETVRQRAEGPCLADRITGTAAQPQRRRDPHPPWRNFRRRGSGCPGMLERTRSA